MRSFLRNSFSSASLLLGLIALGGCNTASQEPQISAPMQPSAMAVSNATVMSSNVRLSGGHDCASVVSDWQAIQDNDLRMGHVHPSVYALISKDIASARTACSAGRDAEARSLVQASRARHGYPN